MLQRTLRLGDSREDHCPRCRSLKDHVVVTIVEGQPKRVRCQSCHTEHDYRHGKGGRPKKTEVQSLVQKMLENMPEPRKPPGPKPPRLPHPTKDTFTKKRT